VFSLGASTPTAATLLESLIRTYDEETGAGAFIRVWFSNPELDAALDAATQEFDPETRNERLAEATRLAFEETPVVPLYWQDVYWAANDAITINGGLSEDTLPRK
jgi:peptide/nickel transport system substrate-binding protein